MFVGKIILWLWLAHPFFCLSLSLALSRCFLCSPNLFLLSIIYLLLIVRTIFHIDHRLLKWICLCMLKIKIYHLYQRGLKSREKNIASIRLGFLYSMLTTAAVFLLVKHRRFCFLSAEIISSHKTFISCSQTWIFTRFVLYNHFLNFL